MPTGNPFQKIRRRIIACLSAGLSQHNFAQLQSTAYFVRDRGPIRDALFFQKTRSNAITFAYGVAENPFERPWSPGLKAHRWLADQRFYIVKYEDQVEPSVAKTILDFQAEALPWFARFTTVDDLAESQGTAE